MIHLAPIASGPSPIAEMSLVTAEEKGRLMTGPSLPERQLRLASHAYDSRGDMR